MFAASTRAVGAPACTSAASVLFGWLLGRLLGRLSGCLLGALRLGAARSATRSAVRLAARSYARLADRSGCSVICPAACSVGCLTGSNLTRATMRRTSCQYLLHTYSESGKCYHSFGWFTIASLKGARPPGNEQNHRCPCLRRFLSLSSSVVLSCSGTAASSSPRERRQAGGRSPHTSTCRGGGTARSRRC